MQSELKKSTQRTLTAEERAHQMDQLLAEEEGHTAALERELATLREKQVRVMELASWLEVGCTAHSILQYQCSILSNKISLYYTLRRYMHV